MIAGGKQRIPPATHIEWTVRRSELSTLVKWGLGETRAIHLSAPAERSVAGEGDHAKPGGGGV